MNNTIPFRHFGIMLDESRNAVMRPERIKEYINLLEKMGYNTLMLYTEDTYEVNNQPYFGHLRGRHTKDELKELDAYAKEHNIELIPCIQTLAHLNGLMRWPVYNDLKDCNDIILAGDERVYSLIDDMFSTLAECFSSRICNVGMDEAHGIGLGRYLEINGVENRLNILLKHLQRVSEIAKKYDFELIIWGDMFYKLSEGSKERDIADYSDDLKKLIPDNVNVIYWDYYTADKSLYDKKIQNYQKLKSDVWFAGGAWTWTGFTPKISYSINNTVSAIQSCVENGVNDVFITVWGDDGAECSRFSILPCLYVAAQNAKGNFDLESIKPGFKELFGIDFDDFCMLELTGTPDACEHTPYDPNKYLTYNDFLLGVADSALSGNESEMYKQCADKLKIMCEKYKNNEFAKLFETAYALCRLLEVKSDIGVKTRKAYLSDDKKELESLVGLYDEISTRIDKFYYSLEKSWMWENKPHGFDIQDIRLGGLKQRCIHAKNTITAYCNGGIDKIEELEEPVLDLLCNRLGGPGKPLRYNRWMDIATVNVVSHLVF